MTKATDNRFKADNSAIQCMAIAGRLNRQLTEVIVTIAQS